MPEAVILSDGSSLPMEGLEVAEFNLGLPALNNIVVDSSAALVTGARKTLYLVVTTPLAWVTSGQATWQPFVGRTTFAAASGAASQLDVNHVLLGAAQNLGAAAQTSLPAGLYRLSSVTLAELGAADPYVGAELKFPSALTAGAATLYLEVTT